LNCLTTKYNRKQLILRKISKAGVRCQILRLICSKFYFCWGSAPDPAGGTYSTPQTPELDLRGLLLTEGKGKRRERREGFRNSKYAHAINITHCLIPLLHY